MAELKVDLEFVRETWELPGHLPVHVDADNTVGLWDSERLLVSKYFSKERRIVGIGCGVGNEGRSPPPAAITCRCTN